MTSTSAVPYALVVDVEHSSVGFTIRFMSMTPFRRRFGDISVTVAVEVDQIRVTGSARVDSLDVDAPARFRERLMGPEFFDVERHPELTFSRADLSVDTTGRVTGAGELTMRGVSRRVPVTGEWHPPETDGMGHLRAHLTLAAVVSRRVFGFAWDAPLLSGAAGLDDEVQIVADIALVPPTTPDD